MNNRPEPLVHADLLWFRLAVSQMPSGKWPELRQSAGLQVHGTIGILTAMKNHLIVSMSNLWIYLWYARVIIRHVLTCGEIPNVAHPKTVNEKFLWRKVFDRNPAFISLSDKLLCKQIAKQQCPNILLPKVLWVGEDAAEIPAVYLQGDVIVKATHGSGFCFPIFGGKYDRDELLTVTGDWMGTRYGWRHWEWGYFGVRPQLYVEELILDENGGYGTTEAKMYVYSGKIRQIVLIYDRQLEPSATVLHGDWTNSSSTNSMGIGGADRPLPTNPEIIEETALQLCNGFDHMRCDLYLVGSKIFFGEYTLYNQGGYILLNNDDELLAAQGASWDIRQSWFLTEPQSGPKAVYAKALLALLNGDEIPDAQRRSSI